MELEYMLMGIITLVTPLAMIGAYHVGVALGDWMWPRMERRFGWPRRAAAKPATEKASGT